MLSEDALDIAISSDIEFEVRSRPSLRTEAYHLRVHKSVCPREGYGIFQSPWNLLEATLSPGQPIWNRFLNRTGGEETRVGSVVFVPRDEPVRCHFTQGTRHTVSCLFDVEALGFERSSSSHWVNLDPSLAFAVRDPFVQIAVQRLCQEALLPSFASELQIECALVFLVAQLQRRFGQHDEAPGGDRTGLPAGDLRRILERINEQEGPAPSLRDLANMARLSAPVFSARFREATGRTLRSYVANARLERAKRYLLDDTEMVKQIAYRCGYRSAAAFTTSFRQETGMTPTQFREALRAH